MGKHSSDEEWSEEASSSPRQKQLPTPRKKQLPAPRQKQLPVIERKKTVRNYRNISDEEWSDDDASTISPPRQKQLPTPRQKQLPVIERKKTVRNYRNSDEWSDDDASTISPPRQKQLPTPRQKQLPAPRQKQLPAPRQKQPPAPKTKKTVTKQSPYQSRKVQFGKTTVKQISKSETNEKLKALKSVKELDEYTQICVTHILSVFNIWDKDDLKERGKQLSDPEKHLIETCIKAHEGKTLNTEEKNTLSKYEKKAMKHISEYRKARINAV